MSEGQADKYFWLGPVDKIKERTPESELVKSGKIKKVTPMKGTTPGDIISGSAVPTLYSEELTNLLKKESIKFKAWKIEIILDEKTRKRVKQPIPNYYYIEPLLFVSKIWDVESFSLKERDTLRKTLDEWMEKGFRIIYSEPEDERLKGFRKTFYNMYEWNGSDLFGAQGSSYVIVTKKLKKIIEKAKLKNIKFEELKEYKYG